MNDKSAGAIPAIDSRSGFAAALKWGFDAAFEQGARRIVCCSPDFHDWPWDDPALLQGLTGWLRRPPPPARCTWMRARG